MKAGCRRLASGCCRPQRGGAHGAPHRRIWPLALVFGLALLVLAGAPAARATATPALPAPAAQQAVPISPGPPPASTHTPAAGKEQRFDKAKISLWLRPAARDMHVSVTLVWTIIWLINLFILLGIIYWGLYRLKGWSLPSLMHNRTRTIRRRIAEADEAVIEATARLRAIEARLAGVQNEITALREETRQEAELEYRRLSAESSAEAEKIARAATRQIETAGKTARQELRHYAGELAVAIAEQRLRHQVDAAVDRDLIHQAAGHFAASGPSQPV